MPSSASFPNLFSPIRIGQVQLKNRIVKTSQAMGMATEDGYVTDAHLELYGALARGGSGLIIVEHSFPCHPIGISNPRNIAISDDKYVPGLSQLVEHIHSYGVPCFVQFGHSGPAQRWGTLPGDQPVSSSALKRSERPYPYYTEARALSVAELDELVDRYGEAARRAREANFDGVEIHAAHNYLLNSFLSRAWNKRDDAYGCQDLSSRGRLVLRILTEIKRRAGKDFAVGVRINGAEYGIKDGITSQESQAFAQMCEEAGADYTSVTGWGFDDYDLLLYPEQLSFPEPVVPLARTVRKPGALVPLAAAVKQVVRVPVLAVGRIDGQLAEWVLAQGKADLIGMGRRLLADPEYPNKLAAGRLEDIAPCTACMECASRVGTGRGASCRINAALGRVNQSPLKPGELRKRVLVVGGGPAGMEAARLLALRGHEVVLCEKEGRLGGLLPLAALIKGTAVEDIPAIIAYLKTQVSKLGVQVRLATEVNAAMIDELRPEVVVLATGSKPTVPEIPGVDRPHVVTSGSLHRQVKGYLGLFGPRVLRWLTRFYLPIGKKVVIVGGLLHGCELAEFLVKRGRKVTVLEQGDQLGTGIPEFNRKRLLHWLVRKHVVLMTGVDYQEIVDAGIVVITKEGDRETIKADTVLVATPPEPNAELLTVLRQKGVEVHVIGDAQEPRCILDAISDGYTIGTSV